MSSASPVQAQASQSSLLLSCVRCFNRKVKCDKKQPQCSACSRHNVECIYRSQQPTRRKAKRIREDSLTERLKAYELLLRHNGIDIPPSSNVREVDNTDLEHDVQNSQSRSPSVQTPQVEEGQTFTKSVLVHSQDRSVFLDKYGTPQAML